MFIRTKFLLQTKNERIWTEGYREKTLKMFNFSTSKLSSALKSLLWSLVLIVELSLAEGRMWSPIEGPVIAASGSALHVAARGTHDPISQLIIRLLLVHHPRIILACNCVSSKQVKQFVHVRDVD